MSERNADPADSENLPLSVVFHLLTEKRRRYILYYLRAHRRPVPLAELIEHLKAHKLDEEQGDSRDGQYQRLLTELHDIHIPLLVDADVVTYDSDTDLLVFADTVRPLDEYLHLAEQHI